MSADSNKDTYAIVGELVLMASALDDCLNRVMIAVLDLGTAPLLLTVVATLDPPRKIEILKAHASHIQNDGWRDGLLSFVKKAETVSRNRNVACHMPPVLEDGTWTLTPLAAVKLLSRLDLDSKTLAHISINDFRNAISMGEGALPRASI